MNLDILSSQIFVGVIRLNFLVYLNRKNDVKRFKLEVITYRKP